MARRFRLKWGYWNPGVAPGQTTAHQLQETTLTLPSLKPGWQMGTWVLQNRSCLTGSFSHLRHFCAHSIILVPHCCHATDPFFPCHIEQTLGQRLRTPHGARDQWTDRAQLPPPLPPREVTGYQHRLLALLAIAMSLALYNA